jgi:hypothetical protein
MAVFKRYAVEERVPARRPASAKGGATAAPVARAARVVSVAAQGSPDENKFTRF